MWSCSCKWLCAFLSPQCRSISSDLVILVFDLIDTINTTYTIDTNDIFNVNDDICSIDTGTFVINTLPH